LFSVSTASCRWVSDTCSMPSRNSSHTTISKEATKARQPSHHRSSAGESQRAARYPLSKTARRIVEVLSS
jgi:hypothetical protein